MGSRTEKRNLRGGHPFRPAHRLKKTAGALIAVFLAAGALSGSDIENADISETKRTFAAIRLSTMNADANEWNGIFQSWSGPIDYRVTAGWASLGRFEFVRSEEYAYSDISIVNGYGVNGALGFLFRLNGWNAGCTGGVESVSVGGDLYRDTAWAFSVRADWLAGFGTLSGKAGWERETPCFSIDYMMNGYVGRIGCEAGVFIERNVNWIIGARAGVRNFRKDLRFGAVFRYGLVYPVYGALSLEAEKTFGPFRITVRMTPSSIENSLFLLDLTFFLDADRESAEDRNG